MSRVRSRGITGSTSWESHHTVWLRLDPPQSSPAKTGPFLFTSCQLVPSIWVRLRVGLNIFRTMASVIGFRTPFTHQPSTSFVNWCGDMTLCRLSSMSSGVIQGTILWGRWYDLMFLFPGACSTHDFPSHSRWPPVHQSLYQPVSS